MNSDVGGVILCGGKSTRMGTSKALLPFGHETMLQRVVRILSEEVRPVVVVAAHGQVLPPLSEEILLAHDSQSNQGPLEGIATGLEALPPDCPAAYITGCDVPLLQPQFVRMMIEALGEQEIAVPKEDRFHHPLAAVYRRHVAVAARRLLSADRRRPLFLFEECRTREVSIECLREVDPDLWTLRNLNRPEDYQTALEIAGFARQ